MVNKFITNEYEDKKLLSSWTVWLTERADPVFHLLLPKYTITKTVRNLLLACHL